MGTFSPKQIKINNLKGRRMRSPELAVKYSAHLVLNKLTGMLTELGKP